MYKIFINEKPFIITRQDVTDNRFVACKRVKYKEHVISGYIRDCEGMQSKGIVMLTDDELTVFKEFYTHFVAIEAAGGLVYNTSGQVLLIKRLGKWDLPKGKIDPGESKIEAALREVMEECGIDSLHIREKLPHTYHTYKMHEHRFLKITHWYSMLSDRKQELVPQIEEHITEAKWFDRDSLNLHQLDTYSSIRDLLESALSV